MVLLPGHAETVTTSIAADTAGVSVIGIGNGDNRPTITVNAGVNCILTTAPNQLFHNLKIVPGTSSTIATKHFAVSGGSSTNGVTFSNCHFQIAATEKQYHLGYVLGAKGSIVTFKDCLFQNLSTVTLAANATINHTALLIRTGDVDVIGCRFIDMGAQKKNAWTQCVMAGSTGTGEDLCSVMFKDTVFTCRGVAIKGRAAAVSPRLSIIRCQGISTSSNTAVANIFQVTYANVVDSYCLGAVNKRAALVPSATE